MKWGLRQSKCPTQAGTQTCRILLGAKGRIAVEVIPERKIKMEIVRQSDTEGVIRCESHAAKVRQAGKQ
jgi:hypothetical protein